MIVVVDVDQGSVELRDADNFGAFHVETPGSGSTVARIAEVLGTPIPEADGHVWVPTQLVREKAAATTDESWNEQFDGMLGYASSKGWLSDDGAWIQAHVVR